MVEEFQNKNQNEEEEDRISLLPDCLIVEILSRLPNTKEAIRTGNDGNMSGIMLLILFSDMILKNTHSPISFHWSTQCRQLKLNKMELRSSYGIQFESQVRNWIRYAMNCYPRQLTLVLFGSAGDTDCDAFDETFFNTSCFTQLKLGGCVFNPTGAISWKNLKILNVSFVKLDEDLVKNILCGSPLLETLALHYFRGFKRLDITSKSVKNLVLSGIIDFGDENNVQTDPFEINAPNILSLTFGCDVILGKLLLLNVPSLVKACLVYSQMVGYDERRYEDDDQLEEEMLKGFMLSLCHVKELKIGMFCSEVLSRLETKGFICPINKECLHAISHLDMSPACSPPFSPRLR